MDTLASVLMASLATLTRDALTLMNASFDLFTNVASAQSASTCRRVIVATVPPGTMGTVGSTASPSRSAPFAVQTLTVRTTPSASCPLERASAERVFLRRAHFAWILTSAQPTRTSAARVLFVSTIREVTRANARRP